MLKKLILCVLVPTVISSCYLLNVKPESESPDAVMDSVHVKRSEYGLEAPDNYIEVRVFPYEQRFADGSVIIKDGYWKRIKISN